MASPKETGVAFGMVGGAGLATTVGGFIVYSAKLGSHGFLGGALAFSAGVMVYISFVDIFFKSVEEFEAAGLSRRRASQLTTAPFFGGCFLVWLMDRIIHSLHASPRHLAAAFAARRLEEGPHFTAGEQSKVTPEGPDPESDNTDSEHGQPRKASERTDLRKLGWLTALSISLHNCATHIVPEGAAVFISSVRSPAVGAAVAVAIALHNIPEGACVSMPLYYASGSRLRGFFWAFLSGITEPFGGLLAFLVLLGNDSRVTFGILFGVVAGMMVYISLVNLLPTAWRYVPGGNLSTAMLMLGMALMAASLILFDEFAPQI